MVPLKKNNTFVSFVVRKILKTKTPLRSIKRNERCKERNEKTGDTIDEEMKAGKTSNNSHAVIHSKLGTYVQRVCIALDISIFD